MTGDRRAAFGTQCSVCDLCKGLGQRQLSSVRLSAQVMAAILKDSEDETTISLLYANQTEDDILVIMPPVPASQHL